MNELIERKWFVYLVDHHEGPHSIDELRDKLAQSIISTQTFAWAEGMKDWKPITEIPEVYTNLLEEGNEPQAVPAEELSSSDELSFQDREAQAVQDENTGKLSLVEFQETKTLGLEAHQDIEFKKQLAEQDLKLELEKKQEEKKAAQQGKPQEKAEKSKAGSFSFLIFTVLSIFIIAGVGAYFSFFKGLNALKAPEISFASILNQKDQILQKIQPFLFAISEKTPWLDRWISPIPELPGVRPEEREELKYIALAPLQTSGAKFAIALSQTEILLPSFYVSSNLADGTALEIQVIGVPATLLNSLSFQKQEKLIIKNRLSHTSPIQLPDSKPIPRGEYRVYLLASEPQTEAAKPYLDRFQSFLLKPPTELTGAKKILAYKTYFLAGKKDETYFLRLKEFHEKLKVKSDQELSEAKQFFVTLESQLSSSRTKYQLLQKGKIFDKQKKAWGHFHERWMQLQGQLDQIFNKWSPEILEKEYIHSNIYDLIKKTGDKIKSLHELQNRVFSDKSSDNSNDLKPNEQQRLDSLSAAQESLSQLQFRIQEAEKLPLTTEGMPQKSFSDPR